MKSKPSKLTWVEAMAIHGVLERDFPWPPKYPRPKTVLHDYGDTSLPREQWGAGEWKAYAAFLERRGAEVTRELYKSKIDLLCARRKMARRKHKPSTGTVLEQFTQSARARAVSKRGRPRSGKTEIEALEVLALKERLQQERERRVPDREAIEEWLSQKGMRRSRVSEKKYLINKMSAIRKSQKV